MIAIVDDGGSGFFSSLTSNGLTVCLADSDNQHVHDVHLRHRCGDREDLQGLPQLDLGGGHPQGQTADQAMRGDFDSPL